MNNNEIVKTLNEISTKPLAELKSASARNTSNEKELDALLQYNAIMDNVTIGPGTTTDIEIAGLKLTYRLLTAKEFIDARVEAINACRDVEVFDDWHMSYQLMIKILAKALTPSPFKLGGRDVPKESDIELLTYDILQELYKRYMFFNDKATKQAEEFTEEEVQSLLSIVRKKPEVLADLDRVQLLIMSKYLLSYSQNLEKITKSE